MVTIKAVLAGAVLMTIGSVIAGIPDPFEPLRMLRLLLVIVLTAFALISLMFLLMVRVTDPLTPRMFVAALVQYSSSNTSLSTNLRFRWEYQPGSEIFVVYNDQRDTLRPGFPELMNRSLIFKTTRLIRF